MSDDHRSHQTRLLIGDYYNKLIYSILHYTDTKRKILVKSLSNSNMLIGSNISNHLFKHYTTTACVKMWQMLTMVETF